MDGHRDAQADIERIEDCHPTQPPWLRMEREHRHGHGEGDGGMRRRPAPENSAAQKAEVEDMTDVRADVVRRMGAAREGLVGNNDQGAEEFSLSDGPAGQNGSGIFGDETKGQQQQRQVDGQQPANNNGGPHPGTKHRIAGGEKPAPVEAGQDKDEREQDGDGVPDEPPAREAANEVARERHQKLLHTELFFTEGNKGNKEKFLFMAFLIFYLVGFRSIHRFAPGRIMRTIASASFTSWKLIMRPTGTSSSFM